MLPVSKVTTNSPSASERFSPGADPTVAITVAAGIADDASIFWRRVADILSAWAGGGRFTIRYGGRATVGSVDAGTSPSQPTREQAHWSDAEGREVTAIARCHGPLPQAPSLETLVRTAGELGKLVERRLVLEHDRRLGSFLVEMSRWMLASASDPRTLLRYALRSVMQLVKADGALVLTRSGAGADLRIAGAEGAATALGGHGLHVTSNVLDRVVESGQGTLSAAGDVIGDDAFRWSMVVPLKATTGIVGALCVLRSPDRADPAPFTLDEMSYLDAVAAHIAGAMELAEAIRAAQNAARRARAMVDGSPLPLALIGPAGEIVQVNGAFVNLLDLSDQDAPVGRPLESVALDFTGETLGEVMAEARTGIPWRGRATAQHGKNARTCDAIVTGLFATDGQEFLLALYDRTDELRAQRELVAREKLATVGELASGVAHEVNNPLAAIRMEAELLGQGAGDADTKEAVLVILKEVDRAARIARSLLHLTSRSGAVAEEVRVNDVLRDVVEIRSRVSRTAGVTIHADLDPELPPVLAPATDLQQVFINLVTNAEHAVEGRDAARIDVASRREGQSVVVTVSDSGPGVPVADRTRIFDPFYTTKDPDKGTGLGLALSRSIIAELGGRIWVDDGPLGGALFTVELPIPSNP